MGSRCGRLPSTSAGPPKWSAPPLLKAVPLNRFASTCAPLMKNVNSSCALSGDGSTATFRARDEANKDATRKDQWVRVTTLGCCREVGRAAFLLTTPDSRVLIDCGEKPDNSNGAPYLYVPEIHPLAQLRRCCPHSRASRSLCTCPPSLQSPVSKVRSIQLRRPGTSPQCSSWIIWMSSTGGSQDPLQLKRGQNLHQPFDHA